MFHRIPDQKSIQTSQDGHNEIGDMSPRRPQFDSSRAVTDMAPGSSQPTDGSVDAMYGGRHLEKYPEDQYYSDKPALENVKNQHQHHEDPKYALGASSLPLASSPYTSSPAGDWASQGCSKTPYTSADARVDIANRYCGHSQVSPYATSGSGESPYANSGSGDLNGAYRMRAVSGGDASEDTTAKMDTSVHHHHRTNLDAERMVQESLKVYFLSSAQKNMNIDHGNDIIGGEPRNDAEKVLVEQPFPSPQHLQATKSPLDAVKANLDSEQDRYREATCTYPTELKSHYQQDRMQNYSFLPHQRVNAEHEPRYSSPSNSELLPENLTVSQANIDVMNTEVQQMKQSPLVSSQQAVMIRRDSHHYMPSENLDSQLSVTRREDPKLDYARENEIGINMSSRVDGMIASPVEKFTRMRPMETSNPMNDATEQIRDFSHMYQRSKTSLRDVNVDLIMNQNDLLYSSYRDSQAPNSDYTSSYNPHLNAPNSSHNLHMNHESLMPANLNHVSESPVHPSIRRPPESPMPQQMYHTSPHSPKDNVSPMRATPSNVQHSYHNIHTAVHTPHPTSVDVNRDLRVHGVDLSISQHSNTQGMLPAVKPSNNSLYGPNSDPHLSYRPTFDQQRAKAHTTDSLFLSSQRNSLVYPQAESHDYNPDLHFSNCAPSAREVASVVSNISDNLVTTSTQHSVMQSHPEMEIQDPNYANGLPSMRNQFDAVLHDQSGHQSPHVPILNQYKNFKSLANDSLKQGNSGRYFDQLYRANEFAGGSNENPSYFGSHNLPQLQFPSYNNDTSCILSDEKFDNIYQDIKPFDQDMSMTGGQHLSSELLHSRVPKPKRPKEPKPPRLPVIHNCKECDRVFKNSTQLKNHMWRHTGEKPFTCEQCGSKFTQQGNLRAHRRIHTGERPYECPVCKNCFTQLSTLKTHQKIHSDERPHKCNLCDAAFRQVANLKTHQVTHTGERPHKCEMCDKAFTQKSNLKAHRNRVHNPDGSFASGSRRGRKKNPAAIKPYACTECGAKFTMMSNLKIHMKLHLGARNFACETCGAAFSHRTNLKMHIQRMHSSIRRKVKCDECPATFRLKRCLKAHKKKRHPMKNVRIKMIGETKYYMRDRSGPGMSEDLDEELIEEAEGCDENTCASEHEDDFKEPKEEPLDSLQDLTTPGSCGDDDGVYPVENVKVEDSSSGECDLPDSTCDGDVPISSRSEVSPGSKSEVRSSQEMAEGSGCSLVSMIQGSRSLTGFDGSIDTRRDQERTLGSTSYDGNLGSTSLDRNLASSSFERPDSVDDGSSLHPTSSVSAGLEKSYEADTAYTSKAHYTTNTGMAFPARNDEIEKVTKDLTVHLDRLSQDFKNNNRNLNTSCEATTEICRDIGASLSSSCDYERPKYDSSRRCSESGSYVVDSSVDIVIARQANPLPTGSEENT